MTDEEKAEDYVKGREDYLNRFATTIEVKQAYLDGLVEKENAELKAQVESLANTNIKAQNIIADLKAEIENYKMSENESLEIIAELKAQNKSLKNTLQAIATDTNEHITHNVAQNELDKWELAE